MSVTLRDVIESDLPIFFAHQDDPEANEMADFPARAEAEFMAHWAKIMRDDEVITKTILYNDQVAGNILSFMQGDKREVGYWIGKPFWGKGIATLALQQFLEQVKIRPLYAYVVKHNIASKRVLEKCGFTLYVEQAQGYVLILE